MRLINTHTLELEDFFDLHVPAYAILSHTWADGEVSLQDWADRANRRFKPGYAKILAACAQARRDDLSFIWVDTNCIDKSSSSELSEAINSMFRWYKRSSVCYAHLSDVAHADLDACKASGSAFRGSRWFTRGWTLQELIAPSVVRFFSADWRELGTKAQLAMAISETTGIGFWCLVRGRHESPLLRYSVAQRMSWASRRRTTRIEDKAYSLLGLFDISMPLIYGEGYAAFTRLLEEIIRQHADQTFLASRLQYVEFLPRSPDDFRDSGHVVGTRSRALAQYYRLDHEPYPFYMANTGLQMTMPVVTTIGRGFVFGVLDCWDLETGTTRTHRAISRVWIPLRKRGHAAVGHYSRLMWPSVFVPVRLLPKDEVCTESIERDDDSNGPGSAEEGPQAGGQEATWREVVDFTSPSLYRKLLIRKPFATPMMPPGWTSHPAGSPFMVCFPRGSKEGHWARHSLYRIFPRANASGKVVNPQASTPLPLVFPARWHEGWHDDDVPDEEGEEGAVESDDEGTTSNSDTADSQRGGESTAADRVYRALVVFVHESASGPRYLAICLANVPVGGCNSARYEPRCKILPDWNPDEKRDLRTLDAGVFPATDKRDGIVVTVQKLACTGERRHLEEMGEPRTVGLTQVVFDLNDLCEDIEANGPGDVPDRQSNWDIWGRGGPGRRRAAQGQG